MRKVGRPNSAQVQVRNKPLMDLILESVANHYSLPKEMILSHSKEAAYTEPRHIAMALGYAFTFNNQDITGKYFGGKNHATVNHSIKNVVNWYETDGNFREIVNTIIGGINYITDKSYSFQNVIDARNKKKNVVDKQDALFTRLQKSIALITNSSDKCSEETLRKLVANLKLVDGEIWSREETIKFKAQLKLEQDAKEQETI
jgi:hypothetical protein